MLRKIQQQSMAIQFIKSKYKQKTGQDLIVPNNLQQFMQNDKNKKLSKDKSKQPTVIKQNSSPFSIAIHNLNLPVKNNNKKAPFTTFSLTNKFHLIQNIKLDGFKNQGFTKQNFKDFLARITQMKNLKSISLKNNALNDQFHDQIDILLNIKRIVRIDFSRNQMGKKCLQAINKNFQHIQWIDLTKNNFMWENQAITNFIAGMKHNIKLFHIAIDLQQIKHMRALTTHLKNKPHIHSFYPIDSKIDSQSMGNICHVLQPNHIRKDLPAPNLISLNFKNCYLQSQVFHHFLKALNSNSTLIQLQLANNNLGDDLAIALFQILQTNRNLTFLGMQNNFLEDQSAKSLSKMLQKNQILQTIDISKNYFTDIGGKQLCLVLSQKNDNLQSLGQIQTNTKISAQTCQKIRKALRINKVSKQLRANLMKKQGQQKISPQQISRHQTEAFLQSEYQDYELLVKFQEFNPIKDQTLKLNQWSFD